MINRQQAETIIKSAYWREQFPNWLRHTSLAKGLRSYVDVLKGKNVQYAENFAQNLAKKKGTAERLWLKEMGKAKGTPQYDKIYNHIANQPSSGDPKAFGKWRDTLYRHARKSGKVDTRRTTRLEGIRQELDAIKGGPSVRGEKMRTGDTRLMTGVVGGTGLYLGGGAAYRSVKARKQAIGPQGMGQTYFVPKIAMSEGQINDIIHKRIKSVAAAGDKAKAYKTTAQLRRMHPMLEKRVGEESAARMVESPTKYLLYMKDKTAEEGKEAAWAGNILPKTKLFNPVRNMFAKAYKAGRANGYPHTTRYIARHSEISPLWAAGAAAPLSIFGSTPPLLAPMLYSKGATKGFKLAIKESTKNMGSAAGKLGKNIKNGFPQRLPAPNLGGY